MFSRFISYEMKKRVCFSQLFISKNSNYSFESIQRELRNRVVIYLWFDEIRVLSISTSVFRVSITKSRFGCRGDDQHTRTFVSSFELRCRWRFHWYSSVIHILVDVYIEERTHLLQELSLTFFNVRHFYNRCRIHCNEMLHIQWFMITLNVNVCNERRRFYFDTLWCKCFIYHDIINNL
jgi:hypothetical protein